MILGSDETGATVEFQPQTFKVARLGVRKKVDAKDVAAAELAPCVRLRGVSRGKWIWGRIWM